MPPVFKGSKGPTLGVEVEVQLIDPASKDLRPGAIALLNAAQTIPELRVKSELTQSMIEINTTICRNAGEAGTNLKRQFGLLQEIAQQNGMEIAVAGTHPFQKWWERKIYPTERYQKILDKFQWLARRLTIFGLHVHVGVASGDRAVAISNALISYIPHLLALSASSPFWGGADTGMASCRTAVFQSMPTGGLPYYFVDWKEFQNYFDSLTRTGAIHSIKDIYWDIRPHFDFGTIEIRVCDGLPTLKETLALVAFTQCLVAWIDSQYQKGTRSPKIHMQRYWVAPENKWQAARYGLEGNIIVDGEGTRRSIREDTALLLETLRPVGVSLNCSRELSWVEEILKAGPSTDRQRGVFAKTGSMTAVVEALIEELKA